MDIIAAALVAAIAKLAEPAVKDAYEGLKALIKRKFQGNTKVEGALDGIEDDPETWSKPLNQALQQANASADSEITAATQNLQQALQAVGVTISVSGNKQIGGRGNVQQNIGQVTGGTVIGRQGKDEDD